MRLLCCGLALLLSACGNATPPPKDSSPPDASASVATVASAPAPAPAPTASAVVDAGSAQPDASADAGAPEDAGAKAAPFAADNKVEPTEGPELVERARGLLEAIAKDEPERGEAFWFPKEPFIPLKDVKDPGKYWNQLHRTYANDIDALHKKRKSWDGAKFVSFSGWSRPKWVKPGDEANKIGYHRAFHGKLRYEIDGKEAEIDVHTIITWQGRWYCTHLRKFRNRDR